MSQLAELWQYVEAVKPEIETALKQFLPIAPAVINTDFNRALHYSIFPGGKRLRPVLTLLGAEIIGARRETVLPTAAAIEFVHTSSLIFDDLPCMDNAPERRGKLTLHQEFNEGTAVLVGLALLNAAYGLVFIETNNDFQNHVKAHAELVNCIGASGMVGGQSIDLALAVNGYEQTNHDDFERLRNLKTSALIRMAITVGALQSGANNDQIKALTDFSELLGDAYQTSDDLLDLTEDLHISNTTTRAKNFALEQGANEAGRRVANLINNAKTVLRQQFGESQPAFLLCAMADYIAARKA